MQSVALLRAVSVGGGSILPMERLRLKFPSGTMRNVNTVAKLSSLTDDSP